MRFLKGLAGYEVRLINFELTTMPHTIDEHECSKSKKLACATLKKQKARIPRDPYGFRLHLNKKQKLKTKLKLLIDLSIDSNIIQGFGITSVKWL